ncbi:hypothetical protein [Streptomyces alfalfae]
MTTPTTGPTGHDQDQVLAERAADSGDWLAGLITAAMLDTAGQPDRLPEYLFADLDLPADTVNRIWRAGLAVGYRAGTLAARPRFHRDTLTRLQAELAVAGYLAMARTTARTLATLGIHPTDGGHPAGHPADGDQHGVRGGHA